MKKILKKIKKLNNKFQTETARMGEKIFAYDLNSTGITNFFFIFFIVMSMAYTALIFSAGQRIKNANYNVPQTYHRNIPSPFENKLRNLTQGKPIEEMVPYIAGKDKKVASYMIAIAKQESNWGASSPKKDGQECYNYWGFRSAYNQTDSGYACFDSPRQATDVVGQRIGELLAEGSGTPKDMSVWKCGYDCSWDNPHDVSRWVQNVGYYYQKVDQ